MASLAPRIGGGRVPQGPASGAPGDFPRPCVVSRPRVDPREGPELPRNVLSERERRRRISGSCARLRMLLPRFEGRREDMASVLEMAVQFLRLVRPGGGDSTRQDLVQVATADQLSMDRHDDDDDDDEGGGGGGGCGSGIAMPRAPGCASSTVVAEDHGGPLPEPSSSGTCTLNSQFFSVPGDSEEFPSCLDTRSLLGSDLEDSTPFLLATSSDCYLGSLEARGGGIPSCALARSSSLDGAELGFLVVPEHGAQELQDSTHEPWGLDIGGKAAGILTDFLA